MPEGVAKIFTHSSFGAEKIMNLQSVLNFSTIQDSNSKMRKISIYNQMVAARRSGVKQNFGFSYSQEPFTSYYIWYLLRAASSHNPPGFDTNKLAIYSHNLIMETLNADVYMVI